MDGEDILNKFKEEIRKNIDEFSELVDSFLEKLSKVEREVDEEKDRLKTWEHLREVRNLSDELKRKRFELKHDLKLKLLEVRKALKENWKARSPDELEALNDQIDGLSDFLDDALDSFDDEVDLFEDRLEELEERIREKIKEMKRAVSVTVLEPPMEIKVPRIRIPEIKIPDVGSLIERSLSSTWIGGPSTIVSSVRLPQADLSLIDALVNAGIFRSRNEGIAFFAHKGIEGSKDWLAKVKEKLEDIRKLQEETKQELEKVLGGSTSRSDEKREDSEREGPAI